MNEINFKGGRSAEIAKEALNLNGIFNLCYLRMKEFSHAKRSCT